MTTTTKLQFRHSQNNIWTDFPQAPTVDNFNNEFPAEFMHSYYNSDYIAWEQDMFMWINDECTQEEFKAKGHDIPTKWQAEDEMKRLRQIILNKTFEDFFSDISNGKLEFRQKLDAEIPSEALVGQGIKATAIFGEDAVRNYDETGEIPSDEWLKLHGGAVNEKTFKTIEEFKAYCEGVDDADGWLESEILDPEITEETTIDCPHCKE